MSNEVTVGLIGALVFLGFGIYLVFSAMRGVTGSLTTAKVGEVYNFEYEQPYHGEPERILAKVIEPVYTLDDLSIRRLNARSAYRRNDPNFKRTKHLVTCEMTDGSIRNFYAERTRNVRRLPISNHLFRTVAAMVL
jgi:hypothetical protein